MTKFEIDWFWLNIEKWWKWAIFGQKVRLEPWYFAQTWPYLKFDWFWLNIEKWWKWAIFGQKSKAIVKQLTFYKQEQMNDEY